MLQWFESDGSTPLGTQSFGKVGPGEDFITKAGNPIQVVLKNTGLTTITDVAIEIRPVSAFPLVEYVRVAVGETEPSSEAYSDSTDPDVVVGDLEADEEAKVWLDLVVPLIAVRGTGQYANLRAYGSES
jgi:hypothetical protein